jgi:hypothetical protein
MDKIRLALKKKLTRRVYISDEKGIWRWLLPYQNLIIYKKGPFLVRGQYIRLLTAHFEKLEYRYKVTSPVVVIQSTCWLPQVVVVEKE